MRIAITFLAFTVLAGLPAAAQTSTPAGSRLRCPGTA